MILIMSMCLLILLIYKLIIIISTQYFASENRKPGAKIRAPGKITGLRL